MVRTPSYDKNGRKKGAWSPEEDEKLRAYVQRYGHWNWRELPKFAGLSRCGKSCRLRWMNYLRPNVKRGNFSKAEEEIIMKLHEQLGNKWSAMAAKLPGRTDNEIKNYWHTHLKKRSKQNPAESLVNVDQKRESESENVHGHSPAQYILESFSMSPEPESESSSSDVSTLSSDDAQDKEMKWLAEESITSSQTFAELPDENFWTEPFLTDDFHFDFSLDFYTQYYFPDGGVINSLYYDSYCSQETDLFADIWYAN